MQSCLKRLGMPQRRNCPDQSEEPTAPWTPLVDTFLLRSLRSLSSRVFRRRSVIKVGSFEAGGVEGHCKRKTICHLRYSICLNTIQRWSPGCNHITPLTWKPYNAETYQNYEPSVTLTMYSLFFSAKDRVRRATCSSLGLGTFSKGFWKHFKMFWKWFRIEMFVYILTKTKNGAQNETKFVSPNCFQILR